jgi:hypothetical protein
MDKKPLIGKWLAVGLFVLLSMNIVPAVGSLSVIYTTEQVKIMLLSGPREDNVTINGTMGENGWYISGVWITIPFDPNYTAAVYYKLDDGDWTLYTGPIYVGNDGRHILLFYYVDYEGNISPTFSYLFKIDSTVPTIMLNVEYLGRSRYRISAETSDATSGVDRVEFYLNNYLIYTVDAAPYEWLYKGPGFKLDAIAYDRAGNSAMPWTHPDEYSYFAIGFIENPQVYDYCTTFYAKFVIFYEHFFPIDRHVSTLINQQFAVPSDYTGNINEHFILIKYHGV